MTQSRIGASSNTSGLLLIFLVMVATMVAFVPGFASLRNLDGLLLSVALTGTIAGTMMLVLSLGEVDLSVASTVAFAGVVAAVTTSASGSVFVGVVAGALAGASVGLLNGVVIAKLRINSLIATLGTMEAVRGLAYIVAHGDAVVITNERFFLIGSSMVLGIGVPVWVMIVGLAVFGFTLNYLVLGRNVLAIGGNREAAHLAGVPVGTIETLIFTLQGLVAGLAGVILTSRLSLGDPKASAGLELSVISACVLGGVSLTGGTATIIGVIVGVFIMGCVQNALALMNVPTFYQYLVRGSILLLAVGFDRWRSRETR